MYRAFLELNFFTNRSSDVTTRKHERKLTQVYIFCLSGTTLALLAYMCFSYQTKTTTIRSPSQSTYEHLLALHPNILIPCPCSRISTPFETLLTIDFDLHPICSSDFVSTDWLDVAFANGNWSAYDRRDFRIRAFAYFSQLASLCALTNKILTNELESFAQRELISTLLIPSEKFDAQFQTIFDEFRVSLASTSIRTLHLFRGVLQGNQLLSIYTTNWMLVRSQTIWDPLQMIPLSHGSNCSCATSNECVEPIVLRLTNETIVEIPGLLLGCLPIESISSFDAGLFL